MNGNEVFDEASQKEYDFWKINNHRKDGWQKVEVKHG